ncbi:MAG: hypothetical protein ACR2G2_13555 [Pseudonocardia sp.]
MAESLAVGDFYPDDAIAAFAWPLLLQAGGLARLDGGKLVLTAKGRAALGQPSADVSVGCGNAGHGTRRSMSSAGSSRSKGSAQRQH